MSVIVEPMKLSDVLKGKKPRSPATPKTKSAKPKVPGAPKRARKGVIARTLFVADVVNAAAANKKKAKREKKEVKLPKVVYIVMNRTRSEPVSVHLTEIGAQKSYWAETAATGECFDTIKCPSGTD